MRRLRGLMRGENGAAIMWLAGSLVAMLAFASLAIDLGWYYVNGSRLQRAADAAALAGVVHLPTYASQAATDATYAANANGFTIGGDTTIDVVPTADNQLRVTLATKVPTFLARVIGVDSLAIKRTATAEYIKPVAMGSPSRCFGNDPLGTFCPSNSQYWAAVSAPYTLKADGDPYSTRCVNNGGSYSSCSSNNPEYQRGAGYHGYYYAVDVPGGASDIDLYLFDAVFRQRPSYPTVETADARFYPGSSGNLGVTTHFALFAPDSTPGDPTDNSTLVCSQLDLPPTTSSSNPYVWKWVKTCDLPDVQGLYVLRVWSSNTGSGSNQYSIAATSGAGPQPRVYAIHDMSIFSNSNTGTPPGDRLDLAEIKEVHAGKQLELSFFDSGDASGTSWMRVKMPDGTTPTCSWVVEDAFRNLVGSGSGTCEWNTTKPGPMKVYNNQWIVATVDIPDSYTCGPDCYWWVELQLTQPNERTTWKARVVGNPVRLVPNAP